MRRIWGMSGMIMRGVEKIFNSDNMRTNLELWLIIEERYSKYQNHHSERLLCGCLFWAVNSGDISFLEFIHLNRIITEYGRKKGKDAGKPFWDISQTKPRIIFIHRQILKAIRNE